MSSETTGIRQCVPSHLKTKTKHLTPRLLTVLLVVVGEIMQEFVQAGS